MKEARKEVRKKRKEGRKQRETERKESENERKEAKTEKNRKKEERKKEIQKDWAAAALPSENVISIQAELMAFRPSHAMLLFARQLKWNLVTFRAVFVMFSFSRIFFSIYFMRRIILLFFKRVLPKCAERVSSVDIGESISLLSRLKEGLLFEK